MNHAMPSTKTTPPRAQRANEQPEPPTPAPEERKRMGDDPSYTRHWAKTNQPAIGSGYASYLFTETGPKYGLTEDEFIACVGYLKALRSPHWVGEWFERIVRWIVDERWRPTPQDLMQDLVSAASQFNRDIEAAREMTELYPELVRGEGAE